VTLTVVWSAPSSRAAVERRDILAMKVIKMWKWFSLSWRY
jgi:hypothetical protein